MLFSVEGESEESVGVLSTQHPILFLATTASCVHSAPPFPACLPVGFKDFTGRKYEINRY